jgi:two-component system CheB/CheR fusion protein
VRAVRVARCTEGLAFSRLDLVACRNLLIYLNEDAQRRLIDVLHFCLRPGGLLLLGTSEAVDEERSLFDILDKTHRIYAQRPGLRPGLPVPMGASALARVLQAREQAGAQGAIAPKYGPELRAVSPWQPPRTISWGELHLKLLERHAAASIVVNGDQEMLHLSGHAGRYLQHSGGSPTNDLLRSVHPMLRIELRAALYRAAQSQSQSVAVVHAVPFEIDGERRRVDIRVVPAGDLVRDVYLVTFEFEHAAEAAADGSAAASDASARDLERELERLKGQLRDTTKQYESSSEELKASNEELQAMNEELRSATEELETGREELQSINEELTTVNQELKLKVDQLSRANSDLTNLMAATAIATVFVDRKLCIMRYTPSAVPLFRLIPGDIGRPLSDLANRLDYPDILADAQRAIDDLETAQREVRSGPLWFFARVMPYRSTEDRIGGAVFTFLDITARKQAEEALRRSEERMRAIVSQAWAGIANTSLDGEIALANRRFAEIAGRAEQDVVGQRIEDLTHPDDRVRERELFARLAEENLRGRKAAGARRPHRRMGRPPSRRCGMSADGCSPRW